MKQLIADAFKPPPGAHVGKGEDLPNGYAILPQQSEAQLQLAEAHTRLDRVLSFLIRELGYTFLDDAKPRKGGGVGLKAPEKGPNAWAAGQKSARLPAGVPEVNDEEVNIVRIGPEVSKYAQYPEDLILVNRFTGVLVEAVPAAAEKVKNEAFFKVVLQGVRLLHLCDFEYSDVVLVLAYASIYFHTTFDAIGHMMSEAEAAHVCTLLIFLAHSFVLDETCPLRCWRKFIFKKYCTLKVLDAALYRLFKMRGFRLLITAEEERDAIYSLLSQPVPGGAWDVGDASIASAIANLKQGKLEATKGHSVPNSNGKLAANGQRDGRPSDQGAWSNAHGEGANGRLRKDSPDQNGSKHAIPCGRELVGEAVGRGVVHPGAIVQPAELRLTTQKAGA